MTAYFRHRLARAGVRELKRVWVFEARVEWLVQDVSDELAKLFPGVVVWTSLRPGDAQPDLAVIPYYRHVQDLGRRKKTIRRAARGGPRWIGMYEIAERHLVVIDRRQVTGYLIRLTVEQWIRAAWRAARGARRRLRSFAGLEEAAP